MVFNLSRTQRGEIESKEFLGSDFYRKCRQDNDNCMSFRKTLKGKPDEYDRLLIELNKHFIEFYKNTLFHSEILHQSNNCNCARCT